MTLLCHNCMTPISLPNDWLDNSKYATDDISDILHTCNGEKDKEPSMTCTLSCDAGHTIPFGPDTEHTQQDFFNHAAWWLVHMNCKETKSWPS